VPHVGELRAPRPDEDPDAAALEAAVDALLAGHEPAIAEIARALRVVIRAAFPDAVEEVDAPDGLIAYGRSAKVRDLLFAIAPHTAHVNLQLADGAILPDPDGLIEGTGKRIRHVKVRSVEAATAPALAAIIDAQLAARPAG
jgi:hypothetical protein